ncbi:MAG: transpeptidase family protein [Candidatus Symbiothrix sp.]|jgi:cell division protein FtsI (penicillin-binding protein 3)|nr:transpeptidase family protein [Candidatus Symbiothrix sp.]
MAAKKTIQQKSITRYFLISVVAVLFGMLVFGKACLISFRDGNAWRALGEKQTRDSVEIRAERGDIYSSNMQLLATNEYKYQLKMDFWANQVSKDTLKRYMPELVKALRTELPDSTVRKIESRIWAGWAAREEYERRVKKGEKPSRNRNYLLAREPVNYMQWKNIQSMPFFNKGSNNSGLLVTVQKKRVNPYGTLALRTIGSIYAVDSANRKSGKNGLELYYDSLLRGEPGLGTKRKINGRWMTDADIKQPLNGRDIISTIDIDIQDITEQALVNKLKEVDAELGVAVVMETHTGAIRAITNMGRIYPGVYAERGNYAVNAMIEPGSVFKVITMVAALEDGLVSMTDSVEGYSGQHPFGGKDVFDTHPVTGKMSVVDVMRYSSNIGIAGLIERHYKHDPSRFIEGIYQTGIQKKLDLDIPGTATPNIPSPQDKVWSGTSLSRTSFGYGVEVPPIYILTFYNAIANDGEMVQPMFVSGIMENGKIVEKKKPTVINSKICSSGTLEDIRQMLDSVVNGVGGTGKRNAQSSYVKIAGKTGTSRIAQGGSYSSTQGIFCGFFPADKPQYTCLVYVRRANIGNASGGGTCAPVFKEIAEKIYARNIIKNMKSFPVDTLLPKEPFLKKKWVEGTGVPDVKGMGAKEAVYAMEKAGLRVNLAGKGKVVAQSIPAGNAIAKGQTVELSLK